MPATTFLNSTGKLSMLMPSPNQGLRSNLQSTIPAIKGSNNQLNKQQWLHSAGSASLLLKLSDCGGISKVWLKIELGQRTILKYDETGTESDVNKSCLILKIMHFEQKERKDVGEQATGKTWALFLWSAVPDTLLDSTLSARMYCFQFKFDGSGEQFDQVLKTCIHQRHQAVLSNNFSMRKPQQTGMKNQSVSHNFVPLSVELALGQSDRACDGGDQRALKDAINLCLMDPSFPSFVDSVEDAWREIDTCTRLFRPQPAAYQENLISCTRKRGKTNEKA